MEEHVTDSCALVANPKAQQGKTKDQLYRQPHKDIADLVQIPPNPVLSISPDKTKARRIHAYHTFHTSV